MLVEGHVSCSELYEGTGVSSWQVVHQSSKLAGWHCGIESLEALSTVCRGKVSFYFGFKFCVEGLY